uniref:NADH-ubiquinone oxidoreductase chain 6 n=1 Tax=Corallianassa coutierei TaxID=1267413 RepID=L0EAJ7_CORCW|nr:NADH dehydrogenase subunit 6 [Corallianassa coutierei]AGA56164.1 NADH dehydrogenase subunit 6 [Corallianassa coutierei]
MNYSLKILLFFCPLMFYLSLLFIRLSHPLSMGLVLLIQTCLVCISCGVMSLSFWFSYVLFLVFLGGMLVLFIYVASLASNESFYLSMSGFLFFLGFLVFSLIMVFLDNLTVSVGVNLMSSELTSILIDEDLVKTVYSDSIMIFTLYIVSYLLLTLFVVVEITGNFFGPLRFST